MTSAASIGASAIWMLLALLVLCWIARGYRKYRLDVFRNQIFELRSELFELAARQEIPFDSPAYGTLRTTMNGFIRFGHQVSLVSHVVMRSAVSSDELDALVSHSPLAQFPRALKALTPETQEAVNIIRQRMHMAVLEQLLFGSPWIILIVGLVVAPAAGTVVIGSAVAKIYTKYQQRLDRSVFPIFDGRAYAEAEGLTRITDFAPAFA